MTQKFTAVRQIKPYFIYDPRVLQKLCPYLPHRQHNAPAQRLQTCKLTSLITKCSFRKGFLNKKDKLQDTSGKTNGYNSQNITHSVHCCTSSRISKSTFKVKGDQSQPNKNTNFPLQYNGQIFLVS